MVGGSARTHGPPFADRDVSIDHVDPLREKTSTTPPWARDEPSAGFVWYGIPTASRSCCSERLPPNPVAPIGWRNACRLHTPDARVSTYTDPTVADASTGTSVWS